MELINASDLLCLVCNVIIDLNSCINIFYISLPHNGNTLADLVMKVLKLSPPDLQSPYLCLQCYNLFETLEKAQWTVTNTQSEILKTFKNCSKIRQEVIEKFPENEGLNQINQSKVNIINCLSGKDLTSLNSNSNQILTNTIPNDVQITCNSTPYVINANGKTHTLVKKCSQNNKISTELEVSLDVDVSDEIIKNPDAENIKLLSCQEEDGISTLEKSTNNEKDLSSFVRPEKKAPAPAGDNAHHQKSINASASKHTGHQPNSSSKHSCPVCDKKCRTPAQLRTHLGAHSQARPYVCEQCGRGYKLQKALEIHVGIVHESGASPFRCVHCDKCFTQKGALQRHLPLHTGDRPYQCELCGKRFVHHTSYRMHELSHSGKKSYNCQVCDLSLLSTSHLKRHMRVHTGEKPYACRLCDRSFAERYNLQAHAKIHDPRRMSAKMAKRSNRHKCNQCDASFPKKLLLEEHAKQLHSGDSAKSNDKWLMMDGERDDLLETCVNQVWKSLSKGEEQLMEIHDNVGLS